MDLNEIKNIIENKNLSEQHKRSSIISIIAKDKNVIPTILEILKYEREENENLILDQNLELSRVLVLLEDKNLKFNKKVIVDPSFVIKKIKEHYIKWEKRIKCNFKIDGLE